ncbi:fimbrial protein [Providencia burhodogranariea]|uniref:Fimbria adhesin protein n=1 Tax=Providencia burhodogranariea DSM 19968 TaxID=1141662 RepID=K8W866_9GAMM|nr:Fimbria adhesin protein [Providencia burhodogranariea DSM 19968]
MKSFKNKSLVFILLFSQFPSAYSITESSIYVNINDIFISGPADRTSYGTVIANSGLWSGKLCNSRELDYTLASISYEPTLKWTGNTYQATPSHPTIYLYDSGISGLSIVPKGGSSSFNAELSPVYPGQDLISLAPQRKIAWKGSKGNDDRVNNPIPLSSAAYIYKGPDRLVGQTVIPQQVISRYTCYDPSGVPQEITNVVLKQVIINGSVDTCTPTSKEAFIEMDKIPIGSIENADASSLIGTKQSTFSLLCDPNVTVYFSVVDLFDKTNRTQISSLTDESTASGVGFAITYPVGQKLSFGPDGSAADIPGQEKKLIRRAGNAAANNPVSVDLGFSYVRKPEETIKAGTAKSMIGITYSYQ